MDLFTTFIPYILPPWQQNIFSSTIAAIGKQLKQSVNVFHSLMLYLLLPTIKRLKLCVHDSLHKLHKDSFIEEYG